MCDELTQADDDATLAARGISRRDFAALSAAATAVALWWRGLRHAT